MAACHAVQLAKHLHKHRWAHWNSSPEKAPPLSFPADRSPGTSPPTPGTLSCPSTPFENNSVIRWPLNSLVLSYFLTHVKPFFSPPQETNLLKLCAFYPVRTRTELKIKLQAWSNGFCLQWVNQCFTGFTLRFRKLGGVFSNALNDPTGVVHAATADHYEKSNKEPANNSN